MSERLLRFTRNDNVQCGAIKVQIAVIARVLSEAISRFHNEELVAAVPRYEVRRLQTGATDKF
ncbi:MAG: hypothetical protein IT420_09910 [Candidatus Brocadia sp.]|jgi:hypothetical protein|nr:hypothetical protein [Candidatus Brocadia sp.]MDG5998058.1 hypothetical protein [Candidatus Brocadia sp.]